MIGFGYGYRIGQLRHAAADFSVFIEITTGSMRFEFPSINMGYRIDNLRIVAA